MKDEIFICERCENYFPDYEYSYDCEGERSFIVGYSCFYDLPRAYEKKPTFNWKNICPRFEMDD